GRVVGIADEDLERSAEDKTSSVHFVRFELTPEMKQAVKDGATFKFGCTHPEYVHESVVPPDVAEALRKDLDCRFRRAPSPALFPHSGRRASIPAVPRRSRRSRARETRVRSVA